MARDIPHEESGRRDVYRVNVEGAEGSRTKHSHIKPGVAVICTAGSVHPSPMDTPWTDTELRV